jgi:protein involved in polysaccharide export with SLBB domain
MITRLILFFLLTACSSRYTGEYGADEFVIDSYAVKEETNFSKDPVTILGEVGKPCAISGPVSLRQALGLAGGILINGDSARIQVIRASLPVPKVYLLNWEHIIALPNDSLLLIPGDSVYIPVAPLGKWQHLFQM